MLQKGLDVTSRFVRKENKKDSYLLGGWFFPGWVGKVVSPILKFAAKKLWSDPRLEARKVFIKEVTSSKI